MHDSDYEECMTFFESEENINYIRKSDRDCGCGSISKAYHIY